MPFSDLVFGIQKYQAKPKEFFVLQINPQLSLIATTSPILIERFSINARFIKIALTREDLFYKMGDMPALQKIGNPNLMPLI